MNWNNVDVWNRRESPSVTPRDRPAPYTTHELAKEVARQQLMIDGLRAQGDRLEALTLATETVGAVQSVIDLSTRDVMAANPRLTKEQAAAKALEDHPTLYTRFVNAQQRAQG